MTRSGRLFFERNDNSHGRFPCHFRPFDHKEGRSPGQERRVAGVRHGPRGFRPDETGRGCGRTRAHQRSRRDFVIESLLTAGRRALFRRRPAHERGRRFARLSSAPHHGRRGSARTGAAAVARGGTGGRTAPWVRSPAFARSGDEPRRAARRKPVLRQPPDRPSRRQRRRAAGRRRAWPTAVGRLVDVGAGVGAVGLALLQRMARGARRPCRAGRGPRRRWRRTTPRSTASASARASCASTSREPATRRGGRPRRRRRRSRRHQPAVLRGAERCAPRRTPGGRARMCSPRDGADAARRRWRPGSSPASLCCAPGGRFVIIHRAGRAGANPRRVRTPARRRRHPADPSEGRRASAPDAGRRASKAREARPACAPASCCTMRQGAFTPRAAGHSSRRGADRLGPRADRQGRRRVDRPSA